MAASCRGMVNFFFLSEQREVTFSLPKTRFMGIVIFSIQPSYLKGLHTSTRCASPAAFYLCRAHPPVLSMEHVVQSPNGWQIGRHGPLRPGSPAPIHRVCSHHVRLPDAMATILTVVMYWRLAKLEGLSRGKDLARPRMTKRHMCQLLFPDR